MKKTAKKVELPPADVVKPLTKAQERAFFKSLADQAATSMLKGKLKGFTDKEAKAYHKEIMMVVNRYSILSWERNKK